MIWAICPPKATSHPGPPTALPTGACSFSDWPLFLPVTSWLGAVLLTQGGYGPLFTLFECLLAALHHTEYGKRYIFSRTLTMGPQNTKLNTRLFFQGWFL
jgi:hypothetical protein